MFDLNGLCPLTDADAQFIVGGKDKMVLILESKKKPRPKPAPKVTISFADGFGNHFLDPTEDPW